jgi:regulator of RNase E activity RraB
MAKPDADWSYYRTFLYPDDARLRWIQDRRVVDVLERNGDRLELARRVDHWVYFETVTSRDAFIREVGLLGFEVLTPDGDEELGVQLHRVDLVTVEAIHAVTTTLTEIAAKHRGTYDGWETSVEAAESEA